MIYSRQRARKAYPCAFNRHHQILPGEMYSKETVTPWDLIADDVDDEGRAMASRSNEWGVMRYHLRCRQDAESGIEPEPEEGDREAINALLDTIQEEESSG